MRVEHFAVHLNRFVSEEIGSIHGLRPFFGIVLLRQDVSRSQRTTGTGDIAYLIHVGQRVLRLAHIIDEIGSGFGVLGVLRDYPSVEPYVRTLLGHDIIEHDAHLGCLFYSELRIAGPAEVHPCLAFGHLFLAEIDFPSAYLFLGLEQYLFDGSHALGSDVTDKFVTSNLTALNRIRIGIEHQHRINIAESILHQDTVLKLRIENSRPADEVLAIDELRVIDEARCAPHITGGVVAHFDIRRRRHLLEFLRYERRYIVEIVNAVRNQVFLNGQHQTFFEHTLNDILGRAEHIVVLVSHFNLGERGLVDVEGLVHQLYFFAGLLIVPLFEVRLDTFVNIVRPVEHFQLMCAVRTATGR